MRGSFIYPGLPGNRANHEYDFSKFEKLLRNFSENISYDFEHEESLDDLENYENYKLPNNSF